ncbi:hypothetical protein KIH86_17770 [Paenibacillus sp. HN-1]|uniref:hypothetical protein n=1 Tax=Paenibacillus TaxID=44249 RepID=UPI001CA860C3|nr:MULTISPECIES: hypothetical protein [Paenibacillus]MBY9078282.1 hypothetical protein [Paenibacillus sp. CGMCC 1.18879]MBY9086059.1 hypothetical protein [Paenibacillus sinensis]
MGLYITPGDYDRAAANGICAATLEQRVRIYGWDTERACTQPVRQQADRSEWRAVADRNGITATAFYRRLSVGWSPERAATERMVPVEESLRRGREVRRKYPLEWIETAARNGIPAVLFRERVREQGWSYERAATEPPMSRSESGRLGKQALLRRKADEVGSF